MLNPTANNWILPIEGEYFRADSAETLHKIQIQEQGQQILIAMQPAVTFNQLNQTWWESYFSKMKFADLKTTAELLGVDPYMKTKKIYYVLALSDHYRARFK